MSRNVRFICVDGADGVGKTTQLKLLGKYLEEKGRPVYYNRLLGGTGKDWLQNQIRKLLLDPEFPANDVLDEERLFALTDIRGLGYAQNWLDENPTGVVLHDRGLGSHFAYAMAKGMSLSQAETVHYDTITTYESLHYNYGAVDIILVPEDERMAMERVQARGEATTPRLENLETQRKVIGFMKEYAKDWQRGDDTVSLFRENPAVLFEVARPDGISAVQAKIMKGLADLGIEF